jgi:hypothetical protein
MLWDNDDRQMNGNSRGMEPCAECCRNICLVWQHLPADTEHQHSYDVNNINHVNFAAMLTILLNVSDILLPFFNL